MSGPANPFWRDGVTYIRPKGNYKGGILVKVLPGYEPTETRSSGYCFEHRLIVSVLLRRPLTRVEVVHHVDHNPKNNDPSNLMLFACQRDHKLYEAHGTPEPLWRGSDLSI